MGRGTTLRLRRLSGVSKVERHTGYGVEQGQRWLDGRMEFTVVEVRGDEVEVKYLDDPARHRA